MSSAGQPTIRLAAYPLWEYRTIKFHAGGFMGKDIDVNDINTYLNEAGEEGWEVVSALPLQNGIEILVIMKRLRQG
jgi:hypothetical protein